MEHKQISILAMSKEEKIEILNLIINNIDGSFFEWFVEKYLDDKNIDTENIINSEEMYDDLCWMFHGVVDKSLELYKQLLQLPQRTIETLEVGDIVITTNQVGRVAFLIETETQRYIYSKNKDWFNITDIIPREAIELLKDLYQK